MGVQGPLRTRSGTTYCSRSKDCAWAPQSGKFKHRMLPQIQAMMGPGSRTTSRGVPGLPGVRVQPGTMQRTLPPNKLQVLHQKLGQQAPDVKADAEQLLSELKGEALQLTTSELSLQEGEAEFGLQLLRTLLGDSVDTARIQSASILVALRHLNDLLGQLQVATYDRQESEAMSLFSAIFSWGIDEHDMRAARNMLARMTWQLFSDMRTSGTLDGRQLQVLLRELSLHRSAYKQKLLFALRQQIMTTRQDPTALASKVVVLRQMFPGDVGALVAHHPRLMMVELAVLQSVAREASELATPETDTLAMLNRVYVAEATAAAAPSAPSGQGHSTAVNTENGS